MMDPQGLLEIGRWLRQQQYHFVTVTPLTHQRVLRRDFNGQDILRDLFGWNREVRADLVPKNLLDLMAKSGITQLHQDRIKSKVRFSSLDDMLFVHSSFPTEDKDSVFFGPDSYRFIRFLNQRITSVRRLVDMGCGSGVGGLFLGAKFAARNLPLEEILLTDINQQALDFSGVNAQLNQVGPIRLIKGSMLEGVPPEAELIIANPPYIVDSSHRSYRDGGSDFGSEISVRMLKESLAYLGRGGQFALYTGAAVVNGTDILFQQIEPILRQSGVSYGYEELDPDVFGEELNHKAYSGVDRIAAIGLHVQV